MSLGGGAHPARGTSRGDASNPDASKTPPPRRRDGTPASSSTAPTSLGPWEPPFARASNAGGSCSPASSARWSTNLGGRGASRSSFLPKARRAASRRSATAEAEPPSTPKRCATWARARGERRADGPGGRGCGAAGVQGHRGEQERRSDHHRVRQGQRRVDMFQRSVSRPPANRGRERERETAGQRS